jgi:hypothetical protein
MLLSLYISPIFCPTFYYFLAIKVYVGRFGQFKAHYDAQAIGGAHQQTSERAAPPVSVEEKGKTAGDKKENCYYFCLWAYKIKINFFMLLGGPQNTITSHLVFTALFCFAPFSVFFSRMSAPYFKTHYQNI